MGKAFYDEDSAAQANALAVLGDEAISWTASDQWTGIAGKTNRTTGKFAVGGGKEYAYATWRTLGDPSSAEAKQIRGAGAVPDPA